LIHVLNVNYQTVTKIVIDLKVWNNFCAKLFGFKQMYKYSIWILYICTIKVLCNQF